ncbi:hypothetical protein OSTOST_12514 [Ostertagia ostertagi]
MLINAEPAIVDLAQKRRMLATKERIGGALGSTLGLKCLSQLSTWAYCASDAADQTGCCKKRGGFQLLLLLGSDCVHMQAIMQCQKEGLGAKPRYDPDWSSTCEWEGK